MENNKVSSYSSAGVFPVKLLQCSDVVDQYQRIKPVHIQLNLTNKCNLTCSFCSCQNRDRYKEMDFEKARKIIDMYAQLGCQAITITGGGEPTLYKDLPLIIKLCHQLGIKVGLVTNGIDIDNVKNLDLVTWIRVSFDDGRHFDHTFKHNLISAVTKNSKVDWSFSYVVTRKPDYGQIIRVIELANEFIFTHVRIVADLLDLPNAVDMAVIRERITHYVNLGKVLFQSRQDYTRGDKKCLISLLKPVITVDGDIYPCCGTQYAKADSKFTYDETMKMGTVTDLHNIYYLQEYFDGSACERCYYDNYNIALSNMTADIDHKEFV